LFVVVITGPLAAAWGFWLYQDKGSLRRLRKRATTIGLTASSVSVACLLGALVHSIALGGFTEHRRLFALWSRPGVIAGMVGLVLLCFGSSLSRFLGVVSSAIILASWMLTVMAH
jgi:hypothetical protein